MEILDILKNSSDELYPEDLDFFETELATGDYKPEYIDECRREISKIRKWLSSDDDGEDEVESVAASTSKKKPTAPKGLFMGIADIAPKDANPVAASMTADQLILSEIDALRDDEAYKSKFKKYIASKKEIDEAFIEKNFSFFDSWELDAVISVMQMSEEFLEKYFGTFSHDKIARYQKFSEEFFMKHFSQMNAEIVLLHGKNEWRKKENRSKQLDVFLRLKGVKI